MLLCARARHNGAHGRTGGPSCALRHGVCATRLVRHRAVSDPNVVRSNIFAKQGGHTRNTRYVALAQCDGAVQACRCLYRRRPGRRLQRCARHRACCGWPRAPRRACRAARRSQHLLTSSTRRMHVACKRALEDRSTMVVHHSSLLRSTTTRSSQKWVPMHAPEIRVSQSHVLRQRKWTARSLVFVRRF